MLWGARSGPPRAPTMKHQAAECFPALVIPAVSFPPASLRFFRTKTSAAWTPDQVKNGIWGHRGTSPQRHVPTQHPIDWQGCYRCPGLGLRCLPGVTVLRARQMKGWELLHDHQVTQEAQAVRDP